MTARIAREERAARLGRVTALLGGVALVSCLASLLGCSDVVPFACSSDSQCISDSAGQGSCEPDGYCSFDDAGCDSGRRYGKHAPQDRSEVCVPVCIEEIALGELHGCMRINDGSVKCWGDNAGFKLGLDVEGTDHVPPTTVGNLRNVTDLGAGDSHTCVISGEEGRILCWGQNGSGQLGAMPPDGSKSAVQVRSASGEPILQATEVAGGRAHSCARTDLQPDTVLCWGDNRKCQLGIQRCQPSETNYLPQSATAVDNSAPQNFGVVRELALGGDNSCVLLDNGNAACWGDNADGQICGAMQPVVGIALIEPVGMVDTIAHSGTLGCVSSDSSVQCCGLGQPGNPSNIGIGIDSLTAGATHVCGLADGRVFCGGTNEKGQLGQGHFNELNEVVEVSGLPPIVQIEAAGSFTCALAASGRLLCWGDNVRGQVDPSDEAEAIATPTAKLNEAVSCLPPP